MPYKALIELDALRQHFDKPMAEVARHFGVCTTFFKRICRVHGIKRWPYRKMQSFERQIEQIKLNYTTQQSGKLAELNKALAHLQTTGTPPPTEELEPKLRPSPTMLDPAEPVQWVHPQPVRDSSKVGHPAMFVPFGHFDPSSLQQMSMMMNGFWKPHPAACSSQVAVNPGSSDEQQEEETVSGILAGLFKETLTRHSISECLSDPHEHALKLQEFDSYQGSAAYVFEIDTSGELSTVPTLMGGPGTARFSYISRGSYDVYGLTPEEVGTGPWRRAHLLQPTR